MLRRIARGSAPLTLTAVAAFVWLFGACGNGNDLVVAELEGGSGAFAVPDAGTTLPDADLVSYCPSNKCPGSLTTCPKSQFPCDVDLLTDIDNCGECDHRCSGSTAGDAILRCLDGKCVLVCGIPPAKIECDGIPDNGCETDSVTDENCGGCGIKCPDPGKPCMPNGGTPQCGCASGKILCVTPTGSRNCVDPNSADAHCGACNVVCDPAGDGGALPPNTYFGCVDGQCGRRKCKSSLFSHFMDCDGDINLPGSNGCEADAWSRDNCGGCGNACAAEQECQGNEGWSPMCACPPGLVYCATACIDIAGTRTCFEGRCTDIGSDRQNCGSCGHACPDPVETPYSTSSCNYGTCRLECLHGRADCNGNPADDCEVNTDSDPRNCGECGKVCDAIAGQACVRGQCVVAPCQADGGAPQ